MMNLQQNFEEVMSNIFNLCDSDVSLGHNLSAISLSEHYNKHDNDTKADPFFKSHLSKSDLSNNEITALAQESSQRVKKLLKTGDNKVVFLSVKTTGKGDNIQIVDIGIINLKGSVLYQKSFKPAANALIHDSAQQELINNNISWSEELPVIAQLLKGKHIIIYDAHKGFNALTSTCDAFGLNANWVDYLDGWCAMRIAANAFDIKLSKGSISLQTAALKSDLKIRHADSNAVNDCLMTRDLIISISKIS